MIKRIILHWTAGAGYPNACDKKHYHFLFDIAGNFHKGDFRVEDNFKCVKNCYAAHTGGGNTGSIGVSLCGMMKRNGKYLFPLTEIQVKNATKFCAALCKKYGLKPSRETILTHYEFGQKHPKTTSFGKIDITFLPFRPEIEREKVGDYLREAIKEKL